MFQVQMLRVALCRLPAAPDPAARVADQVAILSSLVDPQAISAAMKTAVT